MSRLINIIGDGIELMFRIPENTTDQEVEDFWGLYDKTNQESDFESFMEEEYPEAEFERVYVDEIYV